MMLRDDEMWLNEKLFARGGGKQKDKMSSFHEDWFKCWGRKSGEGA